jgi:hypothetical protein
MFTNSCQPFQCSLQCPLDFTPELYGQDQAFYSHHYVSAHQDSCSAHISDFTWSLMLYSLQMPYLAYISHQPSNPSPPAEAHVSQVPHVGVKMTVHYWQHLETFISARYECFRKWCLAGQAVGLQGVLSNVVLPVQPKAIRDASSFNLCPLSQSFKDFEELCVVTMDYIQAAYKYGAFAHMTMHWCIDCIMSVNVETRPHFGVDDNLMGVVYVHSTEGPWLQDLLRHGIPVWGIWLRQHGMDVRLMQNLRHNSPDNNQFAGILDGAKVKMVAHNVYVWLLMEYDCPDPWIVAPHHYPRVPADEIMEDFVLQHVLSGDFPMPVPNSLVPDLFMVNCLKETFGLGPFTPVRGSEDHSAKDDGYLSSGSVLPAYVQPTKGETDTEYNQWVAVATARKKKAKATADGEQGAARELMKQAHNGDQEALGDIRHWLAAAKGKKAKYLSHFDACVVAEWRDPCNT